MGVFSGRYIANIQDPVCAFFGVYGHVELILRCRKTWDRAENRLCVLLLLVLIFILRSKRKISPSSKVLVRDCHGEGHITSPETHDLREMFRYRQAQSAQVRLTTVDGKQTTFQARVKV